MSNLGRRFQFGRPTKMDPLGKVADLFDISHSAGKGQSHWEQEVRGVLSQYRTGEQLPANPENDEREIQEIKYRVVGYDEWLQSKRKMQNLDMVKKSVGEEVEAEKVLTSSFAQDIKPNKYIDGFGNVYEKIKEEE